jgi:hypothetical protein
MQSIEKLRPQVRRYDSNSRGRHTFLLHGVTSTGLVSGVATLSWNFDYFLPFLSLCPSSLLCHRDSLAPCSRYPTAAGSFGTPLRTLLKSVNQMFNLCQLRLEMLISLAKCLFKFGYEVHISPVELLSRVDDSHSRHRVNASHFCHNGVTIVGRIVTARSLANTHMEPPSW